MFDWSKQQMNINKKDVNMIPGRPGERRSTDPPNLNQTSPNRACTWHKGEAESNITQKEAKQNPRGDVKTQLNYKEIMARYHTTANGTNSTQVCRIQTRNHFWYWFGFHSNSCRLKCLACNQGEGIRG
ncbi:hypothetical protein Q5P01_015620 [Channa striata]|uniref:Uncharacterized protein n=1 Tax=Channa striata TaxID=64152 RepID=A0AA88SFF1_CHASR|nr:hypothetical protein Q5P01_015620 [Channa striata]